MRYLCITFLFLTIGIKGYGQNLISYNDGILYEGDSIITVDEFKVLLESRDLMTNQNYFLIRSAESNQRSAENRSSFVIAGGILMSSYIPTAMYFNNGGDIWGASDFQLMYGIVSLAALPAGALFMLTSLTPYERISQRRMNKVISQYNDVIQTEK